MFRLIFSILIFFVFLACKDYKKDYKPQLICSDSSCIQEEYFLNGSLKSRTSFSLDGIMNGEDIEYDSTNGSIDRWKWFDTSNRFPGIIVYYSNNYFTSFKGTPFLSAGTDRFGKIFIEMINPPNVKYQLGYRDFVGNKVVKQQAYIPEIMGKTAWVTLNEHEFKPGHTYFVYYYFLDQDEIILDSAYTQIAE